MFLREIYTAGLFSSPFPCILALATVEIIRPARQQEDMAMRPARQQEDMAMTSSNNLARCVRLSESHILHRTTHLKYF
jgi:hypothetical protein